MRLIDADKLLECYEGLDKYHVPVGVVKANIEDMPTIDAVPVRHGRWEQKRVFGSGVVDQMQSAYCPVCHRYHTTPYLYYFSHYEYCPNCGAKMDGGDDQ